MMADAQTASFDLAIQKARTAAFFSHTDAGVMLAQARLDAYVDAAEADGVMLDGTIAFSTRAIGFLNQPIFPPAARRAFSHGPFSLERDRFSIFNTGLQLDLITGLFVASITTEVPTCSTLDRVPNGIAPSPGGIPLYRNGSLGGGIGVAGDGTDQDDLIAFAATAGFEAPPQMRSDTIRVRGVRLPYAVFQRNHDL